MKEGKDRIMKGEMMGMRRFHFLFFMIPAIMIWSPPSLARDLRVGIDREVPTIHHAIKLAGPGDTIHLEPGKIYRDYAGFYGKKGDPGKPIILDGHGATLEGSDPLDPAQWTEVSPGHFTCAGLMPALNGAMLARWFFLFDGRMQRMERVSKGKSAPLKKPEDLAPGEWTFVQTSPPAKDHGVPIEGVFHLRFEPGKTLAEANIAVPVRSAGVQFGGENAHLVIRNLTATHPYNDGFNIHGDCREVVFENIRAIECGDDGISAHGTCQYRVDGLVSIGNATGICDTGTARTGYSNVFIADCVGFDLYFLDEGRYSLTNVLVLSKSQNPFVVTGRATGECRLTMENVYLRRLVEPRLGNIAARAVVEGKRCTFEGLELKLAGSATWENTLINGQPSEPGATGADLEALRKLAPPSYQLP
jgi:hypothetical protein